MKKKQALVLDVQRSPISQQHWEVLVVIPYKRAVEDAIQGMIEKTFKYKKKVFTTEAPKIGEWILVGVL